MHTNKLPAARNENLVVQEMGKELLIYDLQTHQAYQLNETSMTVFNACGNRTSFDELKRKYKFTDDLIHLTLDRLKDENLIQDYNSRFAGISRREAIKKVGLATMIALPVIVGITAPAAAHAASNAACARIGEACTFNNGTQAGCCNTLRCAGFNQCVALLARRRHGELRFDGVLLQRHFDPDWSGKYILQLQLIFGTRAVSAALTCTSSIYLVTLKVE